MRSALVLALLALQLTSSAHATEGDVDLLPGRIIERGSGDAIAAACLLRVEEQCKYFQFVLLPEGDATKMSDLGRGNLTVDDVKLKLDRESAFSKFFGDSSHYGSSFVSVLLTGKKGGTLKTAEDSEDSKKQPNDGTTSDLTSDDTAESQAVPAEDNGPSPEKWKISPGRATDLVLNLFLATLATGADAARLPVFLLEKGMKRNAENRKVYEVKELMIIDARHGTSRVSRRRFEKLKELVGSF